MLVGNPDPGVVKDKKSVIRVIIRGVDNLDPLSPEKAISESIKRFRVVQHKIKVPEVAEAIKGRLESSVSNFIIATILPFDDVSKSEVIIVPITIQ